MSRSWKSGLWDVEDATASRHFQVISAFGAWSHHLASVGDDGLWRAMDRTIARPLQCRGILEGLGDLRLQRRTGNDLKPDLLAKLRLRLDDSPMAGCGRAARLRLGWLANSTHLGRPRGGWEALKAIGWSIQKPRPKNPKSATPKKRRHLEKARECRCRGGGKAPGQTDRGLRHGRASHWPKAHHAPRVGATRRRPIADGHQWFDWLYVTAFISLATGETLWYVSNGVSKEFFGLCSKPLRARPKRAWPHHLARTRQCGMAWAANLKIPDGVRLIYLPPYIPAAPAETLWALVASRSLTAHRDHRPSTRKRRPASPSGARQIQAELASLVARIAPN